MADCISFFNGDWIPTEECKLDVFDRGLHMGDAVFDVARTYNGKPFKIERHFERMQRSLKYARLDIGMTMDEFGKIIIDAGKSKYPLMICYINLIKIISVFL